MNKKILAIALGASLVGQSASPAFAQRGGGARGSRGGSVQRSTTPGGRNVSTYQGSQGRTGTQVSGPRGSAGTAQGPRGSVSGAQGPRGSAARGPSGQSYARNSYNYGGRTYNRPAWNSGQVNVYQRNFVGYPGFHSYGTYYGLTPGLAVFGSLAFLSAGMLIGSYAQQSKTVYVYVVDEGGKNIEYRVDDKGNVVSKKAVP